MTTKRDEVVFPAGDEIEGFWNLDKMHAPRPVSPLSFDLVVRTLAEGFTKANEDYDCPIMASTKEINHYLYFAFHPVPDEAEVARRMVHYHEKLAEKVPAVGKIWEEQWKPEVIASNVPLKTADWSNLGDEELLAKLDELTDRMRYQWWIHGHINFVLLSSSAFCDLYDRVMQPEEPTEAYRMLQGFPTTSVDAAKGLWALSRLALTSPVLRELFETKQGAELLAALDETDDGREFRRRLDEFLFEFGWRHDAVYDLADVPWHEDPAIPLGNIRAMMGLPESEDPELQYQANVAAREGLFVKLREKLADDPDTMAKLDELYEAARYSFPLTEDHAFYIDQMFIGVFRRFVLAVGDRLVANGVFDQPDDVFYLYRDEVVDALQNGGDQRELVGRAPRQLRACRQGHPTQPPRHPAARTGGPRPVHQCRRHPFARGQATRGEHRLQRDQGGGGVTRRVHRQGPRVSLPRPGHRRARSRRDHDRRDDLAPLGPVVLPRRRRRHRRGRHPVSQRDRRP